MEDLADVLNKERRYAEAEALLRAAVRVLGGMPASNNDSLPAAEVSLGHALLQQKHFREAERFLSAGYAFYQKQPQRSPDRLREAREDLAAVYHGMKEHDKTGRLHEGRSDGTRVKEGH
jgi:tetratricopeptide (TPR) repeat protein